MEEPLMVPNHHWVVTSPRTCTCEVLPPKFRAAVTTGVSALVLTLGTVLYLAGYPTSSIFELLGGLSVIATALAWAVNTGQRLLPVSSWSGLAQLGRLA
jgi:hypothetical protein